MVKSRGIWQPALLGFLLAAGFATAWCLLLAWLVSALSPRPVWERLVFRRDGTPLIQSAWRVRDLAGNEVESEEEQWLYGTPLAADGASPAIERPTPWEYRLRAFLDTGRPPGIWYLVCDGRQHGTAYLVGYHSETHARLGYIGKNGFQETAPTPAECLPFDGSGTSFWTSGVQRRIQSQQHYYGYGSSSISRSAAPGEFPSWVLLMQGDDDRIYRVDLKTRKINVLLEAPRLQATALSWINRSQRDMIATLAVRADDAVLVLDTKYKPMRKVPLPAELRGKGITWAETTTGTSLAWTETWGAIGDGTNEYHVYWLDASGRVTRRENITLHQRSSAFMRYLMGPILPAPVPMGVFAFCIWPLNALADSQVATLGEGEALAFEIYWPSLLVTLVIGAALAWRTYQRETRYATPNRERFIWTVFVFGLGLFGWIGYRYGRLWPALVPCPSCHTTVPRDRGVCAACHNEFPLPALKGTEIFA